MSGTLNWTVTVLTLTVSVWGAYTAYDASKAKQPFDKHSAVAQSFQSEINSAQKRGDDEKVSKLRIEYEVYESDWRKSQLLAERLNVGRTIGFTIIPTAERLEIVSLFSNISSINRSAVLSIQEQADISFLSENYDSAIQGYGALTRQNPNNVYAAYYGAIAVINAKAEESETQIPKSEIESILNSLKVIERKAGNTAIALNEIKKLEINLEQELLLTNGFK